MGSIRTLSGRGTLFIDFRFDGRRCREYTALADTAANRKRLQRALAAIESEIARGTFVYATYFPDSRATPVVTDARPAATSQTTSGESSTGEPPMSSVPEAPSLRTFADQWMRDHEVEWRRSHIRVLRSTIDKHLLPALGDKPVASIAKSDVLAFRSKLAELPGRSRETMSNKRINGVLAPLRQILNDAADRFGFVSPTLSLKPLKVRKTDVEPFTIDEVQRLLATARADYHDYFIVRFFTGMRTGEAHGLKWKYVKFDDRLILIRETFVLGEDEYTKTDSSQRDIQMTQVVYDALMRQEAATRELSEYVFCNREGKPLDNKNFADRVWAPLLRHLGLKLRRPYQMRHTAATLWLACGEAPEWIARQLGHCSTEMLFRVYSRYVPNLTRRDGSAIDRLPTSRLIGDGPAAIGAEKGPPPPPPP